MKRIAFIVLAVILSGCGGMPRDPNQQAKYYADLAKTEFEKGRVESATIVLARAATFPGGAAEAQRVLNETPAMRSAQVAYLKGKIATLWNPAQVIEFKRRLNQTADSGLLTPAESAELRVELSKFIEQSNLAGTVPFLIDGEFEHFPELASARHSAIAFERTLKYYQEAKGTRDFQALLKFATRSGSPSAETRRIATELPRMNIKALELPALETLYPEFVAQRRTQITAKVFLAVKNADRLFADDLRAKLEQSTKGVVWVGAPESDAIHLTIERVRNDEKTTPEKLETVTYSQTDVNFVSAALLMPRNASYLFEQVSGGVSLEYGYVVTARFDPAPISENVVRGKAEATYRKCQNARIKNVFGGESRADFVANPDMQKRCAGPSSASMDDLRNEVLGKIAEQVLEVPRIKAVHLAN